MMRFGRFVSSRGLPFLFLLVVGAGSCIQTNPAGPSSAALTITVEPTPLVVRVACQEIVPGLPPPRECLVTMSPTVTVRETAGVGGRIEGIDITLRVATQEDRLVLGSDWVTSHAGTDRLEAFGAVAFQPLVTNYPVPYNRSPTIQIVLTVRFHDDKGNSLSQTVQLST